MSAVVSTQLRAALRTSQSVMPFPLDHALAVTEWMPPYNVQIPTATTEESVVALLTQGLTTLTFVCITADQDISVTYGTAGSNVPVSLTAHGVHLLSGTSLTALAISNASGVTANVTIFVAGS